MVSETTPLIKRPKMARQRSSILDLDVQRAPTIPYVPIFLVFMTNFVDTLGGSISLPVKQVFVKSHFGCLFMILHTVFWLRFCPFTVKVFTRAIL